ncbi:hypothetical protein JRO89_XS02G0035300 [Xanthoceras sorbifolium]|uniref:Uncharacterized protein n=1 Tax=Xanthoceras sorbifolium TaxID=99658 RepID=A0ABQ8IEC8_9ROSI|nr:hypothetical protein JRO89_XS02G0035300 [Xanthoceras sorbifolium]
MVSTNSSDAFLQQVQDPEEFLCLSSEGGGGEENDLSYWEFINTSEADADDGGGDDVNIDIDSLSLDSLETGLLVSLHSSLSSSIAIPQDTHFDTSLDLDQQRVGYQYRDDDDDDQEEDKGTHADEEDMYDDDGDGGYDLDDELVPRSVSGKLGRQRMRKLGKRGFAKMFNSKRSPFLFTKPGCVHGKHGLGLKHSC